MTAEHYDTAAEAAHQLYEEGLTLIPLGSPYETPPRWLVDRCKKPDGTLEEALAEAKEKWPKTPRVTTWREFQTLAVPPETMAGWQRSFPDCNWAILTGKEIVVVDADSDEARAWIEAGNITRPQRMVETARGRHYYYGRNPNLEIRNSTGKCKIDIRGFGGYVVAPGSVHSSGVVYTEQRNPTWPDCSPAGLPTLTADDLAAINRFNGGGASTKDSSGNLNFTAGPVPGAIVGEGMRNATLASTVGRDIRAGDSFTEVLAKAHAWNQQLPAPLPAGEVDRTAFSVAQTHTRNHPEAPVPLVPAPVMPEGTAFFGHAGEFIRAAGPIDWLVKGYWPRDSVCMLFGELGTGKSFVAYDLGACVATGTPWMGQRTKQGAVFVIAGEGENGIGRRLLAWQIARGVALIEGPPLFISHASVPLMDKRHADELQKIIQDMADLHQVRPELIIIDTLATNFGAGDESSNSDMGAFVAHITNSLRRPFKACVVLIHHPGHGAKDRARGAYALPAGIDVNFRLAKSENNPAQIELTNLKVKESAAPKTLTLALEIIELPFTNEDSEPETSCVANLQPAINLNLQPLKAPTGGNQTTALAALRDLYNTQRDNLEAGGFPAKTAMVYTSQWRTAAGLDRKRFAEVQKALIELAAIRIEGPFVYLNDANSVRIDPE